MNEAKKRRETNGLRRLAIYAGLATVLVATLALGAISTMPERGAQSTSNAGLRTNSGGSFAYDYQWGNSTTDWHAFEFVAEEFSTAPTLGRLDLNLLNPSGGTILGTTIYLMASQNTHTAPSLNVTCSYEYTTSGTDGSAYNSGTNCAIPNGGAIIVWISGSVCGQTNCAPITQNSGNGPSGSITLSGAGTLQFPNTAWNQYNPYEEGYCMYIPDGW